MRCILYRPGVAVLFADTEASHMMLVYVLPNVRGSATAIGGDWQMAYMGMLGRAGCRNAADTSLVSARKM